MVEGGGFSPEFDHVVGRKGMLMRLMLNVCLLALLVSGCAPAIKEHMRVATDQRLQEVVDSDRRVGPPATHEFKPWAPGQWAAYRTFSGKERLPSFVQIQVLDQSDDGIWLQTESQTYYGRTVSRVLYAKMPTTADEALDLMKKIVVEADDQEPQEMDFTVDNPIVRMMKGTMKQHVGWGHASTQVSYEGATEVRVPAGTFEGCGTYRATVNVAGTSYTATSYVHPEVPLGGTVRSVSEDGEHVSELIDYGF